ncbi:MAG TPA: hypothetical protein VEZ88_06530 [Steroidobacteraceae bacterium]|nr:hypothetical protein [Steroidobacteraceae bacterium]
MQALPGRLAFATLYLLLAACAAAPDRVREQLDEQTGVTVTRMGKALEFYSPRPDQGLQATSFAYLGPLEVNRMGARSTYLWLSVLPGSDAQGRAFEQDAPRQLRFFIDTESFEPEIAATAGKQIDLGARAYPRPARWAREIYLSASPELLGKLATASTLALEINSGDGEWRRYDLWKPDLEGLRAFVAEIAPPAH